MFYYPNIIRKRPLDTFFCEFSLVSFHNYLLYFYDFLKTAVKYGNVFNKTPKPILKSKRFYVGTIRYTLIKVLTIVFFSIELFMFENNEIILFERLLINYYVSCAVA